MALQKQPVPINFQQGINTKTDPYQLPLGRFLTLNNSVFDTAGRLTKRNGYNNITTLPNDMQTTLTTLNGSLVATGSNLYSYSSATSSWVEKGDVQPISLNTLPLVRVSTTQTSPDTAIASNGLCCLVYIDNSVAYYQVSDSKTGIQVVSRTALPSTSVSPRAFVLGQYFVITFIATVSAATHLQYIAIPTNNPTNPTAAADLITTAVSNAAYDAIVANNNLYIGCAASGTTIKAIYLTASLATSSITSVASHSATVMSVTADNSTSSPTIYVSYWVTGANNGFTTQFDANLHTISTTQILTSVPGLVGITSVASNGLCSIFYDTNQDYGGVSNITGNRTDYISIVTITSGATVTGPSIILRSVGLASKAFISSSGTIYMLATFGEANQFTYFLIDSQGNIFMRLAYSNGGGYANSQVLPTVSLNNDTYQVPYLNTDFLAAVNKGTNNPSGTPSNAIYTQTGINLASFGINTSGQYSSEIASALHLTGGQLWEYDGVRPVEHGFHVWPGLTSQPYGSLSSGNLVPDVTYYFQFTYEWTDNAGNLHRSAPSIPVTITIATAPANFTANRTSGSAVLTSVSSFTAIQQGQVITGTGIPANTRIQAFDTSLGTITMTNPASSGSSTSTTITPSTITAVDIAVPTLRLTYKTSPNPVRIVGYQWSSTQQTYYQFTSLTSPVINDPTVDYLTVTVQLNDAQVLGNTLLYTNGGVVENIAAPASIASTIYKNRLFLVDAEDQNLLWFSKQIIEAVPVEMSDLFTLYIAPTIGAQGSTGPITAISSMDDKLIIFKRDAIYYLTGTGPDNTGANNDFSDPVFITASVGCSNPNSIVLMPQGIMFQSDKGIWLLGRDLSTQYIGADVEAYNSQTIKNAQAIPGTNQVLFILENSTTLMYDYFYSQWGTFSNIRAIASTLYQGFHTYLNEFAQILQQTPGVYTDASNPVLMSFMTGWLNVAGLRGYERFYYFLMLGTYYSPFKLNVQLAYDYAAGPEQAILVTPDNQTPGWGDEPNWGAGVGWGGPGNVFQARVFPQKQKCQTFQITVNEIYDPSYGQVPGQGLTLSGLNLVIGVKKGYAPQKASRSFG